MKKSVFILTLLFALVSSTQAQSLKDLLNKKTITNVVSAVTGASGELNMTGTWDYTGPAIELQSDNILEKVGGGLATSGIEDKLNSQLEKVGIKEGATSFTFQSDSTFTVTLKGKAQQGTYNVDASAGKVNLIFAKSVTIPANVSQSNDEMKLTFNADKFMSVISTISSISGNASLSALNGLLQGYDGIQVGLTLKKQGN